MESTGLSELYEEQQANINAAERANTIRATVMAQESRPERQAMGGMGPNG